MKEFYATHPAAKKKARRRFFAMLAAGKIKPK
jgi:hypothetical protein